MQQIQSPILNLKLECLISYKYFFAISPYKGIQQLLKSNPY